jgi:UDP-glucose 4-epimerase
MNILVTGAAGYIGSVLTEALLENGHSVIALDNLKQGHREAVAPGATFVFADLNDPQTLDKTFNEFQIDAVMHLAAETSVEASMANPGDYFRSNVVYGMNLLDAMLKHNVHKLVFSSTAAVYGNPRKVPIEESDPTIPVNPYGESKLTFERILHWYGCACGLKFISLRYFNAAGASKQFGRDHHPETLLIPNILKVALGQAEYMSIFGTDYDTRDGSCIRDYIHVLDIARAHILALQRLENGVCNKAYNLGGGNEYTVLEILKAARDITGTEIPAVVHPRRSGDPVSLIASSDLAQAELGWQPQHSDLKTIIASAWDWQKDHPYGYNTTSKESA